MNIVDIAKAAEAGKADAIVAINTVKAMKIDVDLKIPVLSNKVGGYSGKAIKPIGVRCVYDIAQNVKIPIIGVGGISSGSDALEYIMAGATAVGIGTAWFIYPGIFKKVYDGIKHYIDSRNENISDFTGKAHE